MLGNTPKPNPQENINRMIKKIATVFCLYLILLIWLVNLFFRIPIIATVGFFALTYVFFRFAWRVYIKAIASLIDDPNFFDKADDPKIQVALSRSPTTREIVKEIRKRTPQYQLLRPSHGQEQDNEMLLRTSHSSANTPQDELLRPISNHES